ncbi:hypothetical protein Dimus_003659 [Dionaea muscipula]
MPSPPPPSTEEDEVATNVAAVGTRDVVSPQKTKKRKLMKGTMAACKEKGKDVTDTMAVVPVVVILAAEKEGQSNKIKEKGKVASAELRKDVLSSSFNPQCLHQLCLLHPRPMSYGERQRGDETKKRSFSRTLSHNTRP